MTGTGIKRLSDRPWATAEQALLEAGKSAELTAAFQTVAETESDGRPKFTPKVCRELARVITCRAYGPALLELSHLVVAAEACVGNGRYEDFFWNSGPARSSVFQGYAARRLGAASAVSRPATAGPAGLDLGYGDGVFSISYARMPFLSALMEFLVTTLGYADLDDIWRDMLARGPSKQIVSGTANRLSKALYDYLKEHLPTAQNHRRFARLVAFLAERENGDFEAQSIDDEAVFDFWLGASARQSQDAVDFRTFAHAFRSFVRLRQLLEEARAGQALQQASSIGPDWESGEVEPDSVTRLVEACDETGNPLERLRSPPANGIKFLTKTEAASLELLIDCGEVAFALPLSLMRCEIFGAAQSRISQALRRKLLAEEVIALIDRSVPETYEQRRERYSRLSRHAEKMRLASLHALTRARRPEAVIILRTLRPSVDLEPMLGALARPEPRGDSVVPFSPAAMAERLVADLEDPDIADGTLAEVMKEARQAYRSCARQGFEPLDDMDHGDADRFLSGAEALSDLQKQVAGFCDRLDRIFLPRGGWTEQFAADREVFGEQFHLIYGGT
jgi:hypothetical protein